MHSQAQAWFQPNWVHVLGGQILSPGRTDFHRNRLFCNRFIAKQVFVPPNVQFLNIWWQTCCSRPRDTVYRGLQTAGDTVTSLNGFIQFSSNDLEKRHIFTESQVRNTIHAHQNISQLRFWGTQSRDEIWTCPMKSPPKKRKISIFWPQITAHLQTQGLMQNHFQGVFSARIQKMCNK